MDQGYAALEEIAALLTSGQGTRDDYRELTNRYYTCVPRARLSMLRGELELTNCTLQTSSAGTCRQ